MSHIHNIAGQLTGAADYQAYLAGLRAARQARENERLRQKEEVEAYEGYIDPDAEAEERPKDDNAEEEAAGTPGTEEEAPNAEAGEAPPEGLGKHYA